MKVSELRRMTQKEVVELRASLDGVKARGKNVPKPVRASLSLRTKRSKCDLRYCNSKCKDL